MRASTRFNLIRTSVCATMATVASAIIALAVASLAALPLSPLGAATDLPRSGICHDAAANSPYRLTYNAAAPFGLYLLPGAARRDLARAMDCVTHHPLPICNPRANTVTPCELGSGIAA